MPLFAAERQGMSENAKMKVQRLTLTSMVCMCAITSSWYSSSSNMLFCAAAALDAPVLSEEEAEDEDEDDSWRASSFDAARMAD